MDTPYPHQPKEPDAPNTSPDARFPIAAIGASAGGLEAFSQLLTNLPDNTGMAFVLVRHLDPKHESKLGDILAKSARMPVVEATHGLRAQPNHVYIIPPNATMMISRGVLQLEPRGETPGPHLPIDQFFKSLAADRETGAIAVVLSGTGTDGTLGLEEIKAAGGITMAQDEQSARHSGMPQSAVRSGCVDVVLPPSAIARELARISKHPYVVPVPAAGEPATLVAEKDEFKRVLSLLGGSFGVDFSGYRDTTVRRRIMRRMVLHHKDSLSDYAKQLEQDRPELEALYQDILISVTSFFRDPEVFEALKRSVFPEIVKDKTPMTPLRIWIPGCSTGQEAYSLAMVLVEFLDEKNLRVPIQIFASDLSDTVLHKAREALYPENIESEVSPQRLRRFFDKEDGKYRITKAIRDICLFARHNLATDPPFSHVDLISCRNLLIYLTLPLQKRVIPTFHYALNPNGYLLLGASETVGAFTELFNLVDQKYRIYVKKPASVRPYPYFHADEYHPARATGVRGPAPSFTAPLDWQREADRLVLNEYAPPGVLVNGHLDIIHFRGHTAPYLTPAPGEASLNVLKMAREGLFLELRAALEESKQKHAEVRRPDVRVRNNGQTGPITLRVTPVKLSGLTECCYLILFENAHALRKAAPHLAAAAGTGAPQTRSLEKTGFVAWLRNFFAGGAKGATAKPAPHDDREVLQLQQELSSTREYLQSIIEQQDASNEELKSANEEILSSNEELQSTNEELETAKEELQSVNEELNTINEQLSTRNLELSRLNDDVANLLGSANLPMLSLGADQRIRRFTPAAANLLNLLPTDIGRPIDNFKLTVGIPDLDTLIAEVIATVQVREREVHDQQDRWYLLRVCPYRTAENKIDGVVIVLVDITERKRTEQSRSMLAAIVESSDDAMMGKTLDGTITAWNAGAERLFGYSAREAVGRPMMLIVPPDRHEEERSILQKIARGEHLEPFETVRLNKDNRLIDVSVTISPLRDSAGQIIGAADVTHDITARKQTEAALKEASKRKDEFLAMLAHELRNPLAPLRTGLAVLRHGKTFPAEMERTLAMMERQVQHFARLIDDLLDLSRITHGRIDLRKERVELVPLMNEAVEACRPEIERAAHRLSLGLPQEPFWVEADPVRIVQVMENLLSNAAKYTDRGGRIDLTVHQEDGEAVVGVRDTGIGIAPEALSRIWEPFVQVDQLASASRSGLGIGLTLVRRLVELHDGRVEAHSEGLMKGSEFVVRLPLATAPSQPAPKPPIQALSGRRILVVDDNRDVAESLADLLRLMGNEVALAHDGAEAIQAAASQRPEIILLDLDMPGMSGYDVGRRMRQDHGLDQTLIIALSGYGTEADRQRCLDAGFDGHMVKPIDIEALNGLLTCKSR